MCQTCERKRIKNFILAWIYPQKFSQVFAWRLKTFQLSFVHKASEVELFTQPLNVAALSLEKCTLWMKALMVIASYGVFFGVYDVVDGSRLR